MALHHRSEAITLSLNKSIFLWSVIVSVEVAIVWLYFHLTPTSVDSIRYVLYPFLWINLGLWSVHRAITGMSETKLPGKRSLALISIGYFVLLLVLSGMIGVSQTVGTFPQFSIRWLVPGWGPLVVYEGVFLWANIVPFQWIGFGALTLLVYLLLIQRLTDATVGGLGAMTCVGCSAPVVGGVLTWSGGLGSTFVPLLYRWSYDIGTVMFIGTVFLLLWLIERDR